MLALAIVVKASLNSRIIASRTLNAASSATSYLSLALSSLFARFSSRSVASYSSLLRFLVMLRLQGSAFPNSSSAIRVGAVDLASVLANSTTAV